MSRIESAAKIEGLVGAARHPEYHLGRANSAEQRTYVLHSVACFVSGRDLRTCPYSIALDRGLDLDMWEGWEDVPVVLAIAEDHGDLVPQERLTNQMGAFQ